MNERNDEHNLDQANDLRELMDEINSPQEKTGQLNKEEKEEIDILNLPPRKEVHINKGRSRIRISKPFLRFIMVLILLIFITTWALFGN